MKFNTWFFSTGICCTLLVGCKQPQKQETSATNSNDDIVWKAEFSYCISSEVADWQSLKEGYEFLNANEYNLKVNEVKGHYRDVMKIMYDSSLSNTCPLYSLNPVNALAPELQLTNKERHDIFNITDSIKNSAGQMEAKDYKLTFDKIIGMALNHEWMFDADAGSLKSTITDECIQTLIINRNGEPVPKNAPLLSIAGIRFSKRTNDSLYTQSSAAKPGVVWADDCLFQLIDSTQGPQMREYHNWKTDSTIAYTVNGITTNSETLYPIKIKSCFDKSLVEWIWMAARKGQLPAYSCVGTDSIGQQIPEKEVKNFGAETDTVTDENGKLQMIKTEINTSLLSGLEIKEEIAFHKSTFSFESKITYAGVLVECRDRKNGLAIHNTSKILYWVKLN